MINIWAGGWACLRERERKKRKKEKKKKMILFFLVNKEIKRGICFLIERKEIINK